MKPYSNSGAMTACTGWCTTRSRNGAAEISRRLRVADLERHVAAATSPPAARAPGPGPPSPGWRGTRPAPAPGACPAPAREAAAHNAPNVAIRSNRPSSLGRLMRLPPAADQPARLVEHPRRVLVAALVQVPEVLRKPAQEPQLLDAQVRRRQVPPTVARVRRLDQPLQRRARPAGARSTSVTKCRDRPALRVANLERDLAAGAPRPRPKLALQGQDLRLQVGEECGRPRPPALAQRRP